MNRERAASYLKSAFGDEQPYGLVVDYFDRALEGIITHAQEMQAGIDLLLGRIPGLRENLGNYRTELLKKSWSNDWQPGFREPLPVLTELETVVRYNDNIYLVRYCNRDYPGLDVTAGLSFRRHLQPASYDIIDNVFPEKWTGIDDKDLSPTELAGAALCGVMDELVVHPDNCFLNQILAWLPAVELAE